MDRMVDGLLDFNIFALYFSIEKLDPVSGRNLKDPEMQGSLVQGSLVNGIKKWKRGFPRSLGWKTLEK